jgi:hypothetical protein
MATRAPAVPVSDVWTIVFAVGVLKTVRVAVPVAK